MTAYLAWWFAGGLTGMLAGTFVLRQRRALSWRVMIVYLAAAFGCLYGAKLQYRLRFLPVPEAMLVPPGDLLVSGFHIPLGLVGGFLAAMLACRLVRVPVLAMGDALAMAAAVMMPIGRIGCMVAGCCTGSICPRWWSGFCVVPAGAEESVGPGGGLAAVHPLPVYFAALGLGLVLLYVTLLRRGARPGVLLAAGFLLYPLGQLAIESLRDAAPDRTPLMIRVLLAMLAADVVVVSAIVAARRIRGLRRSVLAAAPVRVRTVVILLACLSIWWGGAARASDGTADAWQTMLGRYVQAPQMHARGVLALARRTGGELPPLARLAVADAYLRSNRLAKAARLFDEIIDDSPGEPWDGFAAVGRGWVAARRGQLDEARDYFEAATVSPGGTGQLADFMVGMLDAGAGRGAEALERFERLAAEPEVPPDLRTAAMVANGYARFWLGDDAGAREAFASVLAEGPSDAARLGDGLAQWRTGDRAGAQETLGALAGGAPDQHATAGMASLDPKALVRGAARAYRHLPLRMPADQVLVLLAPDASGAARVALRRLQGGAEAPGARTGRATGTSARASTPEPATSSRPSTALAGVSEPVHRRAPVSRPTRPLPPWAIILVALCIVALWLRVYRPFSPHRGVR